MFEDLINKYDQLVSEYKSEIESKMDQQDLVDYNEILFSTHSCAIEGNSFSVDETRTLAEKGLGMIPNGKTLLEAFEILDHFKAYEYVLNNLDKELSEGLIKEIHLLAMLNTMSYRVRSDTNPSNPGEYTNVDMSAGDTVFGDHKTLISQLPNLISSTNKALSDNIHPVIVSARFHGFFEYLHPFRDGNGRVGRLVSNFILMKKGLPMTIIPIEKRDEYIQCLKNIRKEGTDEYLVDFFFKVSMERMGNELSEKRTLTKKFSNGFNFSSDSENKNKRKPKLKIK